MIPLSMLQQAREESETGNEQYSRGFVSAVISELIEERQRKIRLYNGLELIVSTWEDSDFENQLAWDLNEIARKTLERN